MSKIEFSKGEKEVIVRKIKLYFFNELEHDVGQFDAGILLGFFPKRLGLIITIVFCMMRGLL